MIIFSVVIECANEDSGKKNLEMKNLTFVILLCALSSVFCLKQSQANRQQNLQQLQNRCLNAQQTSSKDRSCLTQKKLKMQITIGVEDGVFYCLTYKRDTGDVYSFDTVTITLSNPDYDLQYVS